MALQDNRLRYPVPDHISDGGSDAAFVGQSALYDLTGFHVEALAQKVLASDHAEPSRLFTPDDQGILTGDHVFRGKTL